jgi:type II secretory pathway component PulL
MHCALLHWLLEQEIHSQTSQWYLENVCKLGDDTVNVNSTELFAYENNLWKQFK